MDMKLWIVIRTTPVRLVANSEGARPCAKHQPQQCNSFCGWVSPQPRSTDALAANRIGTIRTCYRRLARSLRPLTTFWMGKFETTQGQWKQVMGKLPGPLTAELPEGDDYPVGNINFAEAEAFCHKLTEQGRQSGSLPKDLEFRLPTEAQWEYACRAGTTTATSFGDKLSSKQANFKGKPYNGAAPGPSLNRAAKVGSYPANAWGLHDMHGNIFAWYRDWYHVKLPGGVDPDLYSALTTAAVNRTGDTSRSRRGGAWTDDGWPCRSASRLRFEPARRYDHIGFRVLAVRP